MERTTTLEVRIDETPLLLIILFFFYQTPQPYSAFPVY